MYQPNRLPDRNTDQNSVIMLFKIVVIISSLAVLWSSVIAIFCMFTGCTAKQIDEIAFGKNPVEQIKILKENPGLSDNILKDSNREQQYIINNRKPIMFIVYRPDCPDCHRAYKYIKKEINKLKGKDEKKYEHVFWVPSRTEQGKKIRKNYNVKYVPTIICLYDKNQISKEVLYDENGTKVKTIKYMFSEFSDNYEGGTK